MAEQEGMAVAEVGAAAGAETDTRDPGLAAGLAELAEGARPLRVVDRHRVVAAAARTRRRRTAAAALAGAVAVAGIAGGVALSLRDGDGPATRTRPAGPAPGVASEAPDASRAPSEPPHKPFVPTGPSGLPPGAPVDPLPEGLGNAIHDVGTGPQADTYGDTRMAPGGKAVVYLTDLGRAGAFRADLHARIGPFDDALVEFAQTGHTFRDCKAQVDRVMAARDQLPFHLNGVGYGGDCSSLSVQVDPGEVAAARAYFDGPSSPVLPGFRVQVEVGQILPASAAKP